MGLSRLLPSPGTKRAVALVAIGTALLLSPYLNKAFHLDDPVFLRCAEQIRRHPLAPYDLVYNWDLTPQSMWIVSLHPPVHCYLLASAELVVGSSEIALHLAYLPLAVGCAVMSFLLARQFCQSPYLATALAVFSPAFLVSAGNLMADIPLLFFWLLSVVSAVRAARRNEPAWLWVAGLSGAACALSKYFGIAIAPLLILYWAAGVRRWTAHLAALLLPFIALALWSYYSWRQTGAVHMFSAAGFASEHSDLERFSRQGLDTLVFLGGTLLWPLVLVAGWVSATKLRLLLTLGFGIPVFAYFWMAGEGPNDFLYAAMFVGGLCALTLFVLGSWARRDADGLLLSAWCFGTLTFCALVNWTVNARVILPLTLPAAILAIRWAESQGKLAARWLNWFMVAAIPTLLVSSALAWSDQILANASRDFAQSEIRPLVKSGNQVFFAGHWGLQYYLEEEGATALDFEQSPPGPGNLMAYPIDHPDIWRWALRRDYIADRGYANPLALVTMSRIEDAGFYGSRYGRLPFAIASTEWIDRFIVHIVRPE